MKKRFWKVNCTVCSSVTELSLNHCELTLKFKHLTTTLLPLVVYIVNNWHSKQMSYCILMTTKRIWPVYSAGEVYNALCTMKLQNNWQDPARDHFMKAVLGETTECSVRLVSFYGPGLLMNMYWQEGKRCIKNLMVDAVLKNFPFGFLYKGIHYFY